jgi:hypothetical protein
MCTTDLNSIYVVRVAIVTVHKAKDADLDSLGTNHGEGSPS